MNSATREAFGKALAELGATNPDIVSLDADLSCTTKSATFAKAYPDRFFNMGIAEQDLMATAAGLAACNKIPFASTFSVFATCRALDQIRNSICYPHLNVKVVGTHAGPSCGEDGGSHQAIEDIAIMRSLPNMSVVVPADDVEAYAATKNAVEQLGPMYIRVARLASPTIHDAETYEFHFGKGEVLREGTDVTIIACGMMVPRAIDAGERLAAEGVSAEVINMHTIKPLDEELVLKAAKETGAIVTSEEASVLGGLGGAVAELLAETCPVPVVRHGVNDTFGRSGTAAAVLEYYGLTPEVLAEKCRKAVSMKK